MVLFSKHYPPIKFSCYDVFHPWDASCTRVFCNLGITTFKNSLKIYIPLYMLNALVQKKLLEYQYWPKLVNDVVRSSLFLAFTLSLGAGFGCSISRTMKEFRVWTVFAAAFLASMLAVKFERPERRKTLLIFLLNTVSQSFYTLIKDYKILPQIPNGEVLLFSFTMCIFCYYYKRRQHSRNLVLKVLRFLIGKDEGGPFTKNNDRLQYPTDNKTTPFIKHSLCSHDSTCITNSVKGFVRSFCIGYLGRTTLQITTSLLRLIKNPKLIIRYLTAIQNLQVGLAVGLFTFLFKLSSCFLRWLRDCNDPTNGAFSGFIAGLSMLAFRAPTLASYSFWKMIEFLCYARIETGNIPEVPYFTDILYSILVATLVHLMIFKPTVIGKSFRKFVDSITGPCFNLVNRDLLQVWGATGNDKFPSGLLPDPRFMSGYMKKYIQTQWTIH